MVSLVQPQGTLNPPMVNPIQLQGLLNPPMVNTVQPTPTTSHAGPNSTSRSTQPTPTSNYDNPISTPRTTLPVPLPRLSLKHLIWMYFLLCFHFYVMYFLAEYNTPFLAMIVLLPIIILITSCTICWIGTPTITNQRKKCYNKSFTLNEKSYVEKRKDDKPSREQSNEQVPLDRLSTTISISTLTTIRAFFFAFFIYERQFDFIDHLPIESLLMRIMLATVFRVQFSLIIVSAYTAIKTS